jgi:hypothetical protein
MTPMTYQLLIGQRGHSSWSLRGWLPFAVFDIDVSVVTTRIYSDEFKAEVAAFGGAGTVPASDARRRPPDRQHRHRLAPGRGVSRQGPPARKPIRTAPKRSA